MNIDKFNKRRRRMTNLLDKAEWQLMKAKAKIIAAFHDEKGEVNMIAIILIVIIVIALAAVFRDQITAVVNKMFGKVNEDFGNFDGTANPV